MVNHAKKKEKKRRGGGGGGRGGEPVGECSLTWILVRLTFWLTLLWINPQLLEGAVTFLLQSRVERACCVSCESELHWGLMLIDANEARGIVSLSLRSSRSHIQTFRYLCSRLHDMNMISKGDPTTAWIPKVRQTRNAWRVWRHQSPDFSRIVLNRRSETQATYTKLLQTD